MTSHGGPNPIPSVSASGNSFVNDADELSYEYGLYFEGAVLRPSVGENWYYRIRKANLALDPRSAAAVVGLPPIANRTAVTPAYGPAVAMDAASEAAS